jgi:hypothetical protein
MTQTLIDDRINQVAQEAAGYAAAYVTKGKDRDLGTCSAGCDHKLHQTRLMGMVRQLAVLDPTAVLDTLIHALHDTADAKGKQLGLALATTVHNWAEEETKSGPQLVN